MTHSTPLSNILENKRREVTEREKLRPLETFIDQLTRSDRAFRGGFILEAKKASPSEGLIRPNFDIKAIAKTYAPFAGAISILTDEKFFQGSFDYLQQARELVTCPVLCKDFFISPYQVYEARFHGADMILLMMSVVDDATYTACAWVASKLGMTILTEVHDEHELERALNLGAKIIGVNNRDFKTLKVSLDVSRRLLPLVPKKCLKIVESGIKSHADVREFSGQADGFLVGTSLMREVRMDLALRDLIFGRLKICGLTRLQDAWDAYNSGAGFGGLIFAPESPRCVSLEIARELTEQVPLRWVGVFVNAPIPQVVEYAKKLRLYGIQLHGEESDAYVNELRGKTRSEIWRRISPPFEKGGPGGILGVRVLLDTPHKSLRGGTGQSFDWSKIPADFPKQNAILSGGLNPDNIAQADALGFWALDVNSGVEDSPGLKNLSKIQLVLCSARQLTK
jgi:indole-3-glycerol phosphate synthase/phosphoribosylanthranilate isomerase